MNRRLRVLLVGRHFWPHGSLDSAGFLIQLATGLQRRGIHVEVVTPRYASTWPHQFSFREINVHRPAAAPRGDWSIGRYVRHLTTWLRENAGSFDVIVADAGREEAIAVVDASQSLRCRSIVRIGGHGAHSDIEWWKTSRAAKRCAGFVKLADRVVISTAASHRQLLQAGIPAGRINRVSIGLAAGMARSDPARHQARQTLGAINGDLLADVGSLVVACIGPMTRDSGGGLLSKAARQLIASYPDLQLWFIGDGPERESIHDHLRSEGVRSSIAMPGSFGGLEDVLAAADVYVQADLQGLDFLLPSAIAAELPVVVLDDDAIRQLLADDSIDDRAHWIPEATPSALRMALLGVIENLSSSRENAAALRKSLLRSRPLDQAIDQYAELIQQTVSRGTARPNDASMGAVS